MGSIGRLAMLLDAKTISIVLMDALDADHMHKVPPFWVDWTTSRV